MSNDPSKLRDSIPPRPGSPTRPGKAWRVAAIAVALAALGLALFCFVVAGRGAPPRPSFDELLGRRTGWQAPPDDFAGRWVTYHPDASLWYVGRYAPRPAGEEGPTIPTGRHYVLRPGTVFHIPENLDATAPEINPKANAGGGDDDATAADAVGAIAAVDGGNTRSATAPGGVFPAGAVREILDFDNDGDGDNNNADNTGVQAPALDRGWMPKPKDPAVPFGLSGRWFTFDESGRLSFAGRFIDGRPDGLQRKWLDDGSLTENTMANGLKQGPARAYYPDGAPRLRYHYINDRLEGAFEHFSPAGTLQRRESYADGKLNGPSVQYGPSGRPTMEENYVDGRREGIAAVYGDDGRIVQQMTYSAGEATGPFLQFHPNGRPSVRGSMKNGKPHGLFERFDENGGALSRALYDEGREVDAAKPDWVTDDTQSRRLPEGGEIKN